jgi:peptidoglycan/xylan/chitin deacetylase (PgdA/CDA1 family)
VSITEYYRCPDDVADLGLEGDLNGLKGFFRFGPDAVCYGQAAGTTRPYVNGNLFDAADAVRVRQNKVSLPFDVDQVINNLRYERYVTARENWLDAEWTRDIYYRLRPFLPVALRKHLQRAYLRGWQSRTFPSWPVDRSVDVLSQELMALNLRASKRDRVPFIWFWPEGHRACAILTHDIETKAGRDLTGKLMDVDEAFGFKASIQVVPEKRYQVSQGFLDTIRGRGFEINVHGLDHDGNLFQDRATFIERAKRINEYAVVFGARGFRSPTMYRNVDWLQDLNFSYDMSVPNVARLEPQHGGCCTVMPYFLPGNMLELPLTTTQDYTIFNVLNDYSTTLWKQQIDVIVRSHGLVSLIVHPDYVFSHRAQEVYRQLLEDVRTLQSRAGVWVALPGEVDQWWRERHQMKLVPAGNGWTICGPGSERARIAYACLDQGRLVYEVPRA